MPLTIDALAIGAMQYAALAAKARSHKVKQKPILILGIDQGLGTKSPTGLAMFDNQGNIYETLELWAPKSLDLHGKLDYICKGAKFFEAQRPQKLERPTICIESTVMRGKGGESLQRLVGAIISSFPTHKILHVQNTTVKKVVGKIGSAEKEDVAIGVKEWFKNRNKDSVSKIETLIERAKWDVLDAFAIGIAGLNGIEVKR